MRYDFDRKLDRTLTNDLKWNTTLVEANLHCAVREDMIPMWVADTDFACAPVIVQALRDRVEKEIYGYCAPLTPFYEAIQYWQSSRFNWKVDRSWILNLPSVVAGINIAVRTFSQPGDGVIIQPPVYDPFLSIVKRDNRRVVSNQLIKENGQYVINFPELEQMAADPGNKLMILCSPHNPVGRVWTQEELRRIADICLANDVILVSDEIHSDIVFPGHQHHPVLALDPRYAQNTIHLCATSKTFNTAGLKMSTAIIPNETLRKAVETTQVAMSLDVKNTFGIESVTAAYTPEGAEWLAQELDYLLDNIREVEQFLALRLPKVTMARPQGTFLCWLDCSALGLTDDQLLKRVDIDAGVVCIPGPWFGQGGEQHLRLNVGCTRATLKDALERIATVLQ